MVLKNNKILNRNYRPGARKKILHDRTRNFLIRRIRKDAEMVFVDKSLNV